MAPQDLSPRSLFLALEASSDAIAILQRLPDGAVAVIHANAAASAHMAPLVAALAEQDHLAPVVETSGWKWTLRPGEHEAEIIAAGKPVDSPSELEALQARLADARRDLDSFVYAVSHDLRAPLRAIMSSSMILTEDYGAQIGEEGRSELARQNAAARKLSTLVDELLKLSRLGRGDLARCEVDLASVAAEATAEVLGRRGGNVTLIAEDGVTLDADPVLARTMMLHLIDNAVKFAPTDREVVITVGQECGRAYVRDTGDGFHPEAAARIFVPFERIHPETEYPGMGMGLAYVKKIVDRHGGRVSAEAIPGEGATFWFTLS